MNNIYYRTWVLILGVKYDIIIIAGDFKKGCSYSYSDNTVLSESVNIDTFKKEVNLNTTPDHCQQQINNIIIELFLYESGMLQDTSIVDIDWIKLQIDKIAYAQQCLKNEIVELLI